MEREAMTRFQYRLRGLAGDGEIGELLRALHERCGGQWLYSVHQEYRLYPETPELNEAFFYPDRWTRGPAHPDFPGIQEFCWEDGEDAFHFIYSSLSVGRQEYHLLQLRGREPFTREDFCLLDYASLLAGHMRQLPETSAGITACMSRAYEGLPPESLPQRVFPAVGCGMVLLEQGSTGILRQHGYLGYRLFRSFHKTLRYCFPDENHLLLFAAADRLEQVIEQLHSIVGMEEDDILLGVSDPYPAEQMHLALQEARHAVEIGALMRSGSRVYRHSQLGVFQVLQYPKEGTAARRLIDRMTARLEEYTPAKREALSRTMTAFVDNDFNYQKTADALYAHVNTIRYRIALLEKLWDVDFQREEDRLLFRVLNRVIPLWVRDTGYH